MTTRRSKAPLDGVITSWNSGAASDLISKVRGALTASAAGPPVSG